MHTCKSSGRKKSHHAEMTGVATCKQLAFNGRLYLLKAHHAGFSGKHPPPKGTPKASCTYMLIMALFDPLQNVKASTTSNTAYGRANSTMGKMHIFLE